MSNLANETELLSAYLDNALEAGERSHVEQLLRENPTVVARLEGLRRVTSSLARLERRALPPTLDLGTIQRLASLEDRRGLLDRLEDSLPSWQRSSNLLLLFALITAFSVMTYLLADATWNERQGLIPVVLDPPPEHRVQDLSRARTVYVNGRLFERTARVWIEAGIDPAAPAREVSASGREGSRLLASRPDLRGLLALGEVVLRHENEIIRLVAAKRPSGGL
jgi:anti-sigma factor RsiW